MTRRVHVVGAGVAGLAAAVRLSETPGTRVVLSEATARPGGRCQSFYDALLDRRIDNGNHLILSGNHAVIDYVRRIGASERLRTLDEASFPFVDLADGGRWTVRVPKNPAALLRRDASPFRTGWGDLIDLARLGLAGPDRSVSAAVRARGPMWSAFWEPLTTAVLNAPPERASARLLRAALAGSFLRGAAASRPVLAPEGLGEALVTPAVRLLRARDVAIRYRAPLVEIAVSDGEATGLRFGDGAAFALGPGDGVVLALPPQALARVMPGLRGPGPGMAILNAHFRVAPGDAERAPPILGVLSAQTQWIFRRGDVLSATVSAADGTDVWALDRDAALALIWGEAAAALGLAGAPLGARLLRERAATFDQSPEGSARRLDRRTSLANVVLAGDHVATGLPASLESAVRSGFAAAETFADRRTRAGVGQAFSALSARGQMIKSLF